MSKLAANLADVKVEAPRKSLKSPCHSLYGYGDQEDYEAVERLREQGAEWTQVQQIVDDALGVDYSIDIRKFTRHWRRECSCWQ